MEYKILSSNYHGRLVEQVNKYIKDGWIPVGSHVVNEVRRQNRYSGSQHMDTIIEVEYTQTMVKNEN